MIDYTAALLEQNRLFGAVIGAADPATPVPTCPGWSLQQLLRHVGRGDRWAAQIVREKRDGPLDPRTVEGGKPPADLAGSIDWLHGSALALVDAVAQTGADVPVWTFLGPRPAGWWIRRRLHEATVHRADAAIALGADYDLSPALAVDGLSEGLDRIAANGDRPLGDGVSLHLHATDIDAEWTVRGGPAGVTWTADHERGTAAVRGPAVDLLLALYRRRTAPEVFGDQQVWTTWLENTPF